MQHAHATAPSISEATPRNNSLHLKRKTGKKGKRKKKRERGEKTENTKSFRFFSDAVYERGREMLLPLAPFTCTCTLALRRGTKSPPECHKNTKAGEKVRVKGSSSTCHLCRGLCQPPRWPRDAEAHSGGSQAGLRELALLRETRLYDRVQSFYWPQGDCDSQDTKT